MFKKDVRGYFSVERITKKYRFLLARFIMVGHLTIQFLYFKFVTFEIGTSTQWK